MAYCFFLSSRVASGAFKHRDELYSLPTQNMSPTFLLFIAFAVLAASSIPVLAWGLFFSIFSRRRIYGAKTLFIGCLGGLGSLSLILTLGMIFRTSADHTSIKTLIMIFGAGFGLVGGFYAIVGLFSPMFSYNNRWYSRRRSSRL